MNGTETVAPPDPALFKQSHSSVWVSGLWVISLGLALVVALLAILARQWLVEYRSRNRAVIQSQKRWAWRHMVYRRGLDRWRIDVFIAVLPVMLHIALFFFLAGLALFFGMIHLGLGIIVILITITVALFYAAATILPLWAGDCPTITPLLRLLNDVWQSVGEIVHLLKQQRIPEERRTAHVPPTPAFHDTILLSGDGRGRTSDVLAWMIQTLVDGQEVAATLAALGSLHGEASDPDALGDNSAFGHRVRRIVNCNLAQLLKQPSHIHPLEAAGILRLRARWHCKSLPKTLQWATLRQYDARLLLGASAADDPAGQQQLDLLAQQLGHWFDRHDAPPYLSSTRDVAFETLAGHGPGRWHLIRWDFLALFLLSITKQSVTPRAEKILRLLLRCIDDQRPSATPFPETWGIGNRSWQLMSLCALSHGLASARPSPQDLIHMHRAYGHVLSQTTAARREIVWPDQQTFVAYLSYVGSAAFLRNGALKRGDAWLSLVEILRRAAQSPWKQSDGSYALWAWTSTLTKLYTNALYALTTSGVEDACKHVCVIARIAFDAAGDHIESGHRRIRPSTINLLEPIDCAGVQASMWTVVCSAVPCDDALAQADLCRIVCSVLAALRILFRTDPTRAVQGLSQLLGGDHVYRSLEAAIRAGPKEYSIFAVEAAADLAALAPALWTTFKEQLHSARWDSGPEYNFASVDDFISVVESVTNAEPGPRPRWRPYPPPVSDIPTYPKVVWIRGRGIA